MTLLFVASTASRVAPAPTISIAQGVHLPYIALGTGSGQHGEVMNATRTWLTDSAGVAIDSAIIYKNERAIGHGLASIKAKRSQYFLTTKVVTKDFPYGLPYFNYSSVGAEIDETLQELGVDMLDLLLIHFPATGHNAAAANAEAWHALEAALAAKKTRAIGVSNFRKSDLEALKQTAIVWPPAVNQLEVSISYHDDEALAYNKKEGITVQAYSPLCGGFNGSSCTSHGGINVLTIPEVLDLAAKYGVTPAQIGLKWLVQQGYPLATSIWKLGYMNEDLSLWNFTIADEDMATLAAVYKPAK